MDEERILGEFKKNAGEVVCMSFTVYKGKKLVNLRVYYNAAEEGEEWRPTPKGLTLRRELIPELKEVVNKAAEEYEKELPGPKEEGENQGEKVPF